MDLVSSKNYGKTCLI